MSVNQVDVNSDNERRRRLKEAKQCNCKRCKDYHRKLGIKVKPIKGQRLPIAKLFEDVVLSSLPIHAWEAKQRELRKKIKI